MTDTAQSRFDELKKLKTLDKYVFMREKIAPYAEALRQFDRRTNSWERISYRELADRITAWRRAFSKLNLTRGDCVAILLPNGVDAVCCDMAALGNALVTVPLHAIDTAGSSAFILSDCQAKVLVTNRLNRWEAIQKAGIDLPALETVIFTDDLVTPEENEQVVRYDKESFLATGFGVKRLPRGPVKDDPCSIVYTSGTTGKPKGVVLTHENVVSNVLSTLRHVTAEPGDVFLSFLPVSHTFERMAGYYLPLGMGCTVVFNRSIQLLAEDFRIVRPNVIISVPRIYERIFAKVQTKLSRASGLTRFLFNWAVDVGWRKFCKKNGIACETSAASFLDPIAGPVLQALVAKTLINQFGGRLRVAISGGAALNAKVARAFCGLGLPVIQGYGMTECSPIIAGNSLSFNRPSTVGKPLPDVSVRLDPETHEIEVRAKSVMKEYFHRPEDTRETFTEDGWLKTGDVGKIDQDGFLSIVGRIKEIIVTSTGEKVPPSDLELAIEIDPLFDQAFVLGDNRPFIACMVVLNKDEWQKFAKSIGL
ncbi:MAG TPA: long-chain fatty acid--CoA ligase, partial [Sutterella sp.]|nr:long-chain fatty acid--CoA ligase [Sutterella sp.]